MQWYDKISNYYDFVTSFFYHSARIKLINSLNIDENDRILVVACGTGQSFTLIQEKLRGSGEIIAVDSSYEMLEYARRKVRNNHWENIQLIQMDARELSKEYFIEKGIQDQFEVVLGELAFSVIPEWEKIMKNSVALLKNGGKIGLLDWYRPKNDVMTKMVNYFANSEITRDTESYAKSLVAEYKPIYKFFFQSVYVGKGIK